MVNGFFLVFLFDFVCFLDLGQKIKSHSRTPSAKELLDVINRSGSVKLLPPAAEDPYQPNARSMSNSRVSLKLLS